VVQLRQARVTVDPADSRSLFVKAGFPQHDQHDTARHSMTQHEGWNERERKRLRYQLSIHLRSKGISTLRMPLPPFIYLCPKLVFIQAPSCHCSSAYGSAAVFETATPLFLSIPFKDILCQVLLGRRRGAEHVRVTMFLNLRKRMMQRGFNKMEGDKQNHPAYCWAVFLNRGCCSQCSGAPRGNLVFKKSLKIKKNYFQNVAEPHSKSLWFGTGWVSRLTFSSLSAAESEKVGNHCYWDWILQLNRRNVVVNRKTPAHAGCAKQHQGRCASEIHGRHPLCEKFTENLENMLCPQEPW